MISQIWFVSSWKPASTVGFWSWYRQGGYSQSSFAECWLYLFARSFLVIVCWNVGQITQYELYGAHSTKWQDTQAYLKNLASDSGWYLWTALRIMKIKHNLPMFFSYFTLLKLYARYEINARRNWFSNIVRVSEKREEEPGRGEGDDARHSYSSKDAKSPCIPHQLNIQYSGIGIYCAHL